MHVANWLEGPGTKIGFVLLYIVYVTSGNVEQLEIAFCQYMLIEHGLVPPFRTLTIPSKQGASMQVPSATAVAHALWAEVQLYTATML